MAVGTVQRDAPGPRPPEFPDFDAGNTAVKLDGSGAHFSFADPGAGSAFDFQNGDEVDLIVSHITDIGINVIINEKYKGLLYKDEVYDDAIRAGDRMIGYIKNIRPDNKIDVSLQKQGYENVEPNSEIIIDELRANRGFLRLNDNSHPDDVRTVLKMSKKTFKKAIGLLYKEKIIDIKEDGIYLIESI